jgi:tetratricopeptide (TPR) repeat protein
MTNDEVERLIEKGNSLLDKLRLKLAIEAYDEALSIDPENDTAWISRGLALDDLNRPQEALESFDKALSIDAGNSSAWYMRAGELLVMSRFQDAVESYEQAEKLDPDTFRSMQEGKMEALNKLDNWLNDRWPNHAFKELYMLIFPNEIKLRLFIRHRLQQTLGEKESEWWDKGVPEKIRVECAERWERDSRRKDCFDYLYFIDLMIIMDKKWKIFEQDFQRVKDQFKTKHEFLDGLIKLNNLRDLVAHPTLSVFLEEPLVFARHMQDLINNFIGRD